MMSSTPSNPQPSTSSAQQSQNSQSALHKGPAGGGGANVAHGQEFHLRLVMLLVLRLLGLKESNPDFEYRIWLEKAGYGKFDDIVLKYKTGSGKWTQICLQCKSGEEKIKDDGSKFVKNVTADDFLSAKKTSFSLLDYIKSFSDIKDTTNDCDTHFVLITNREYFNEDDAKYPFLEREDIDLTSAVMFSDLLVGKAFKIKYTSQFEKHILRLIQNIDSETIEEFCDKFLFVCDNRELDVKVHDILSVRSNKNEEKISNSNARLRCLVLDMYQLHAEPTHSDFFNLLNCLNIHYRNQPAHQNFTGRLNEVKNISSALHDKKGGNILDLLVTGIAGMGKTQVVRKYIDDNMHRYKHIIWINAENKHTLDSSILDLAKTCQLINEDGKHDIAVVTKDVYEYFSEETLFVFDNADEVLLLECNRAEYIYLPNNAAYGKNRFIVISRSTKWTTNYAVTVDTFSEEEALLYLDDIIADCTREEKQDLAASVQYWPLALCLAASYIKLELDNSLGRKSFSDAFKTIKIDNENLHAHLPQQHEKDPYNASLRTLWQLIQATLLTKSDLAIKILQILSVSSPDNFPIELFNFDNCSDDEVVRAISILRDNALVTVGKYNISIHRALQAVIRNSVKLDPKLHNDILVLGTASFEKYIIAINKIDFKKTVGNIHMLTFLQHISDSQVPLQTYVKMAVIFFYKLVDSYDILILGENNNTLNQIILKCEQNLGVNCDDALCLMTTKAAILNQMGKYDEALSILNNVIEVQTVKFGKDHPDTLSCMGIKASVLNCLGKFDEALSYYNQVLEIESEKLGEGHPSTFDIMLKKASVLKTMGKYYEALSIYLHVTNVQVKMSGVDHRSTLASMYNIASVFGDLGQYDEALNIYNQVIELETKMFGKDYPKTLSFMNNKALVLNDMGKYDEALSIYNHVIKIETEKLGKDNTSTLTNMQNKATVLCGMGKYVEALSILDHVVEVETKMLGKDHPDTLVSMQNKATLLYNMGKYDEALIIFNYVIEVQTDMLGKDHSIVTSSLNNKASVLDKMGKCAEALNIYSHVIELRTEQFGKDHPDTLNSMNNKAYMLIKMRKYDEALSIYNYVIEVETEQLGKDHPETIASMHNNAALLYTMGKYDEALSNYNVVIEVETKKLGKDHPTTLTSMNNKAYMLDDMGKCGEALAIYNYVIEVMTEKLGSDHPNTLAIVNNRAMLLDRVVDDTIKGFQKNNIKRFFCN